MNNMDKREPYGFWDMLKLESRQEPGLPWEVCKNPFKGFIDTWVLVTFKPKEAFSLPPTQDRKRPFLFVIVTMVLVSMVAFFNLDRLAEFSISTVLMSLFAIPVLLIIILLGLAFEAFILKWIIRIFGYKSDFYLIYRIICYSLSALLFAFIPFIGKPLSFCLSLYICTMGLSAIINIPPARALLPVAISASLPYIPSAIKTIF